jgi:hypothetical protein
VKVAIVRREDYDGIVQGVLSSQFLQDGTACGIDFRGCVITKRQSNRKKHALFVPVT